MESTSKLLIDNTSFINEIHDYYGRQEVHCNESIENSLSALETNFSENDLPHFTNIGINDNFNFNDSENIKIPSPLQIGCLIHSDFDNGRNIPAILDFTKSNGICVELEASNHQESHQFLQNIGLKLSLSLNPRLINLVIIDPEGSGSNFNLLCGYEKSKPNLVLNNSEISSRLATVLLNFTKLQTESLTFKYDNLEALNLNETKLTKPYTFIFISNFPSGFNTESIQLLQNIVSKGAKFGTFVFMSYNPLIKTEWGKEEDVSGLVRKIGLLKKALRGYQLFNAQESELYNKHFVIEPESDIPQRAAEIISHLNNAVKRSSSISISQKDYFDKILNEEINIWQEYQNNSDYNNGIQVPVGLKSATEELEFTIDCGTDNYHSIIGGKTGSGKTVLLDNIIINAALKYSPEELQFVLLDFKGSSFQKYRNLPHLKILFQGNDRSYGLNVLRFLNDENTRRQSILANFGGKISALTRQQRVDFNFPRLIIILDEFQILLKQFDSIKEEASRHIDTIAQQGRSAGMHIILSSQDLTGITISESTQFNSNVRIALQMDPNACKQIFSMDNTEAALLEKKGEAIYNEKPGRPKFGNQRFQVYKLEDAVSKTIIDFLDNKYRANPTSKIDRYFLPNEDSAVITNNIGLIDQLSVNANQLLYPKVFLGEPSFIKINRKTHQKEDSFIQFKRAENSNLLIAGNDMGAASSVLGLMSVQLINQNKGAKFCLLNNFGGDKIQWRERFKLIESKLDSFRYYQKSEAEKMLAEVEEEINNRKNSEEACTTNFYLIVLNLDASFQKQGFSASEAAKRLISILKVGPDLGVHTIVYSYSGKSLMNSGIETDLFESKLILKGDSGDIIKINEGRKEPAKEKMSYLYAPSPVTSVNPDLFNIYSHLDENKLRTCKDGMVGILKEFLKDLE